MIATIDPAAVTVLAAGSIDDPDCEITTGYVAEASTLGFAVGAWPLVLSYADREWTAINAVRHPADGDIIAVDYTDGIDATVLLTVLND